MLYWVLNCIMCYFISFEPFLCGGYCFNDIFDFVEHDNGILVSSVF